MCDSYTVIFIQAKTERRMLSLHDIFIRGNKNNMVIKRDGKEYTLTREELVEAYNEMEHIYDVETVSVRLKSCMGEEDYARLGENEDFIDAVAYQMRKNIDRYEMSFSNALEEAISETLNDFEDEQGDDDSEDDGERRKMVYANPQIRKEEVGDFLRCTDCENLILTVLGGEACDICGSHNLSWADEKKQECTKPDLQQMGYDVQYLDNN